MSTGKERFKRRSGRFTSFKYAISGILYAVRTEVHMRAHLAISIVIGVLGLMIGLSTVEWAVISVCVGLVITAELFNTGIEVFLDAVHPEFNVQIGLVKDITAGAVLVSALFAVIAGMLIFVPKIIVLIS